MRSPFVLTLLSSDPALIEAADAAGVQRIGVDIERVGKRERQRTVSQARISTHELDDLGIVARHVRQAGLFVRLNPLHPGTGEEVERALALGASSLMLPYFRSVDEPARFIDMVAGRAEVVLLVETASAAARIHEIVALPGIDEIMVGPNDLHLDLGLKSPMEVVASDLLKWIAGSVQEAGLRFGFGGVAPPGTPGLPVSADLLLAMYARVGARSAWISRSFFAGGLGPAEFGAAVESVRKRLEFWFAQSPEDLAAAVREFRSAVAAMDPA